MLTHKSDNLSNYDKIEWYQFQQLIESISMQSSGVKEAIEAVRKKLKHGTSEQKLRALEVKWYQVYIKSTILNLISRFCNCLWRILINISIVTNFVPKNELFLIYIYRRVDTS